MQINKYGNINTPFFSSVVGRLCHTNNGGKAIPLAQIKKEQIIIYPNPANSVLNIAYNKIKQITIVDALGKTMMQKEAGGTNNMQLNIEQLQKGIYLIRIIDVKNRVHTTKFIKE